MRNRNRLFVAATLASAIVGFVVSCSFPEVTFAPVGASEGGSTDGSTTDGGIDAPALIDGSDPDALIAREAGAGVDASACDASDCDCDKDGFRTITRAGCTVDAGFDAGATDCDDFDTRAKPGQKYLLDPPVAPTNGNWNCAGGLEKLHTPNLDCTKLTPGSACDSAFGFEDDPACGSEGTYVRCTTVTDVVLFSKCVVTERKLGELQACK